MPRRRAGAAPRRRAGAAPRGRAGWLWLAAAGALVLDAQRLRTRARALRVLGALPDGPDGRPFSGATFRAATATGVPLGEATMGAATAHAHAQGLDVVDLVPATLPTEASLGLLRQVDPATYAEHSLAIGAGALHAVVARDDVLVRGGAPEGRLDAAAFQRLTVELKNSAPRSTDLAVVDSFGGCEEQPSERAAVLRERFGEVAPALAALPLLQTAGLVAGLVVAPWCGALAWAAYCAAPWLALRDGPLRPADLTASRLALRPFLRARDAVLTLRAWPEGPAQPSIPSFEARQRDYGALLAGGVDTLLAPRLVSCPLCGAPDIRHFLELQELIQRKPGRFTLDECASCGHLFQNPPLAGPGFEFYYMDFYDGRRRPLFEFGFRMPEKSYRARAQAVLDHGSPTRWIDVGAGYGHFCLVARDVSPDTRFDGLDQGEGIEAAARRGWVEEAFLRPFPEVATELAEAYDAVSMSHYLEHTSDPSAEIAAASRVLRAGGLLLVELPDPECRTGRLLGRFWGPWFAPQHQHLLSLANLERLLAAEGFEVLRHERGEAHQGSDVVFALLLFTQWVAGPGRQPWAPPPSVAQRIRRAAGLAVCAPLFAVGWALDAALLPLGRRREGWSNAYRVVARKRGEPDPTGPAGARGTAAAASTIAP